MNRSLQPVTCVLSWYFAGAPGRIRTRDPLLRRQLLCPAELRALGDKFAGRRSHDGHAKVAVCRPPDADSPRIRQQPTVPEPPVNDANSDPVRPAELRFRPATLRQTRRQGSSGNPQPAREHGPSGPESPQREKNAQEAAAALGPRGSEYRAEAGSAEPPDQ
jgi:hypothetical protein